jgi:hypothetical protein
MDKIQEIPNMDVYEKFLSYPPKARAKLLALREIIFQVAGDNPEIGALTETLKWGEPSYLTSASKSGTTVRIDWKKSTPDQCYLYVHCNTALIHSFQSLYGSLHYEGNRAIILPINQTLPKKELAHCIKLALTYHLS